jgi:hypothetical protein
MSRAISQCGIPKPGRRTLARCPDIITRNTTVAMWWWDYQRGAGQPGDRANYHNLEKMTLDALKIWSGTHKKGFDASVRCQSAEKWSCDEVLRYSDMAGSNRICGGTDTLQWGFGAIDGGIGFRKESKRRKWNERPDPAFPKEENRSELVVRTINIRSLTTFNGHCTIMRPEPSFSGKKDMTGCFLIYDRVRKEIDLRRFETLSPKGIKISIDVFPI